MVFMLPFSPASVLVALFSLALIIPARRYFVNKGEPLDAFTYTLVAGLLALSVLFAHWSALLSVTIIGIPFRRWARARARRAWQVFRGRAYLPPDDDQ